MNIYALALIVVLAATFVQGTLGWIIVSTCVLYFALDTVWSAFAKRADSRERKLMESIQAEQEKLEHGALKESDVIELPHEHVHQSEVRGVPPDVAEHGGGADSREKVADKVLLSSNSPTTDDGGTGSADGRSQEHEPIAEQA